MNENIIKKRQEAITQSEIRSMGRDKEIKEQRKVAGQRKQEIDIAMSANCRKASKRDYENWLNGHLEKPNAKVTHVYNYALPDSFFVARNDFVLPPGFGSYSVNIIVPIGKIVTTEGPSHNNLYFMDGFKTDGGFVPLFKG